jgi:DNA uptake protein ComE-like DNA-binding protein
MSLNRWWAALTPGRTTGRDSQRLTDPYYRFQNIEEVRLAAQLGVKIDVNQASVDDWLRLPGLSIHQARSLVALTQSGLQFYALEDVAAALSLPVQRLKPLAAILQFCYYASGFSALQLNPNLASVEELIQLPGVEAALAHAIVRDRITRGPYRDLADLQQRHALPADKTAELMHFFGF